MNASTLVPAALVSLAVLDATFAGFRAAAGRSGLIDKRAYLSRALGVGAAAGLVEVALLAALTAATLALSSDPAGDYAELVRIGARMLVPFGAYAALVLLALGVYGVARHEVRTLATVAILGPFTLLRPALIVGAALFGVGGWGEGAGPGRAAPLALTCIASLAVLGTGVLLDRHYGGRLRLRAIMS